MNGEEDDSLERFECDVLAEGHGARVAIRRAPRRVYDALDDRQTGRMQAVMERWCGGNRLTPEMFNPNEGRTPRHNVLMQALKIRKVRLYGFGWTIGDKRTFVIVDADPAKKQDKADSRILKRASRRIDDLIDELETKGKRDGPEQR